MTVRGKLGRLLIGAMFLLATDAAAADETRKIVRDQTWRVCAIDADCVVVESLCPGTYWPINRQYYRKNMRVNTQMRRVTTCPPAGQQSPPAAALCQGGICVFRPE